MRQEILCDKTGIGGTGAGIIRSSKCLCVAKCIVRNHPYSRTSDGAANNPQDAARFLKPCAGTLKCLSLQSREEVGQMTRQAKRRYLTGNLRKCHVTRA